MRARTIVFIAMVPACWVRGPDRNGLDDNLSFEPLFGDSAALGTTEHVTVVRPADGDRVCVEGKSGESCPSEPRVAIAIDAATCGDGCTATVIVDADGYQNSIDVVSSQQDVVLAVDVHALDQSGVWSDRYALHFERATGLGVPTYNRAPVGVAYAAEVDARTLIRVCPLSSEGTCLGGTFTPTVTGDAIAQVTLEPTPESETSKHPPAYFGVHLVAAGTGTVQILALGLARTIAFRAVDPSAWTAIEFVTYTAPDTDSDIAIGGFLGATIPHMTFPHVAPIGGYPLAATAVLAGGERVLLSASHVSCAPEDRVALRSWDQGVGAWAATIELFDWMAPSPGDATCAVVGHESLGGLQVHVDD